VCKYVGEHRTWNAQVNDAALAGKGVAGDGCHLRPVQPAVKVRLKEGEREREREREREIERERYIERDTERERERGAQAAAIRRTESAGW
jgi:3-hydroxyacyl-CoA dehydrogenase